MITQKHGSKGGESNTHKTQNNDHNHAHKPQLELTTQLEEFSTQMGLNSLSQRIECVRMESWCLGMIRECLGDSSMRLGVLFIAPRKLGAVGGNLGRPKLPSFGWHPGQSGVPPDSYCSCPVPDSLPNRVQSTVADWWQLAHQTLSGAPANRWSEPRVARGFGGLPLRWRPLAHRTVRCTTGQSGEL
jgi:hypothetical protein